MATLVKTQIFLDGELLGTVKDASSCSFYVTVGEHSLELKTASNSGAVLSVTIEPDRETTVSFKMSIADSTFHKITKNGIYPKSAAQQTNIIIKPSSSGSGCLSAILTIICFLVIAFIIAYFFLPGFAEGFHWGFNYGMTH